jgi:hypothetical protein
MMGDAQEHQGTGNKKGYREFEGTHVSGGHFGDNI